MVKRRHNLTILPPPLKTAVFCSLLNITLEVLQPKQVLFVVFLPHVISQEDSHTALDPSRLEILVKSILQALIQLTVENQITSENKQNQYIRDENISMVH